MKSIHIFFLTVLGLQLASCAKEQEMPEPIEIEPNYNYNTDTIISKYNYNDMYFFNESVGVMVGSAGRIIKTTDGGTTWTIANSGTIQNIRSVEFLDENNGWAAATGCLLKTTDGGSTWQVIDKPGGISATRNIYSVSFRNANNGIAVCQGGGTSGKFVLVTTNGGVLWEGKTIPTVTGLAAVTDLRGIAWYNDSTAYGVGATGTIIKTSDKGSTWTRVNTINLEAGSVRYNNLFFKNDIGYASGQSGILIKIKPMENDTITFHPLYSVDDGQNDAWFMDENNGYIVGQYGEVHKTNDGGSTWAAQNIDPVAVTLRAVQGFTSGKIYIIGNGVFLKSN